MPIETPILSFAVVGAVNHGKSSVLSTLMQDDSIRISPFPGETISLQRFRLGGLVDFYDTPGFQNPRKVLEEIQNAPRDDDPLEKFRAFSQDHRHEPDFDAECRLLKPILEGAGIIYVVDGSKAISDIYRAELELIRLTGATRLALINYSGAQNHAKEWQSALKQTFNIVRDFNAHSASYKDRESLLDALGSIEVSWAPQLQKTKQVLRDQRESRIGDATSIVVAMVRECLSHSIGQPMLTEDDAARKSAAESLRLQFKKEIAKVEVVAHNAIITLFDHRLVKTSGDSSKMIEEDLFSETTWSLLGLSRSQLIIATTLTLAILGGSLDVFTAGHSLLLGTLLGGTFGFGSAYLLGKNQPEISVTLYWPKQIRKLMPEKLHLSSREIRVGPISAVNFPWILLDRAVAILSYVASRTHALRDQEAIQIEKLLPWLKENQLSVEHWASEERQFCSRFFATLRKDKVLKADDVDQFTAIVHAHVRAVVETADSSILSVLTEQSQI